MSVLAISTAKHANKSRRIESIPDDVLATIFKFGIELKGFLHFNLAVPFEIVATHVSRRWRDLVVNSASLWSNIYITPFHSLDILKICLLRSRRRLLDIDFKLDQSSPPEEEEDSLTVSLAVLVAHVDRWRLFTVGSYSYPTIAQIFATIQDQAAPNLEHFGIYLRKNECQEGLSHTELAFQGSVFTSGAPWLAYFECVGVSIESSWPPLPALTNLRLNVEEFYDEAGAPAEPLSHDRFTELLNSVPTLRYFKLGGLVVDLDEDLLSCAEFHHLVSFDIDFSWDALYGSESNLSSIIISPALTSLKFCNEPAEAGTTLVEMVQNSPKLPKYPVLTSRFPSRGLYRA